MNARLLRAFQHHIVDQANVFLRAASDINGGLDQMEGAQRTEQDNQGRPFSPLSDEEKEGMDRLWYGIQNALIAAANISKALWGQGGKLSTAREPLRTSIGVDDSSPLKDTLMRNHWEHVDERLDLWDSTSQHHNHADQIVGPPSAIRGLDTIDSFRWFDPVNNTVLFWGDTYNLQAIYDEIQRILPKARIAANKPHRDSTPGKGQ